MANNPARNDAERVEILQKLNDAALDLLLLQHRQLALILREVLPAPIQDQVLRSIDMLCQGYRSRGYNEAGYNALAAKLRGKEGDKT